MTNSLRWTRGSRNLLQQILFQVLHVLQSVQSAQARRLGWRQPRQLQNWLIFTVGSVWIALMPRSNAKPSLHTSESNQWISATATLSAVHHISILVQTTVLETNHRPGFEYWCGCYRPLWGHKWNKKITSLICEISNSYIRQIRRNMILEGQSHVQEQDLERDSPPIWSGFIAAYARYQICQQYDAFVGHPESKIYIDSNWLFVRQFSVAGAVQAVLQKLIKASISYLAHQPALTRQLR